MISEGGGPGWFFPLRSKPKEREILAFDIEGGGGVDGFVCGAIEGEYISEFHTDRAEMVKALKAYSADGYWLFAHNLQYDLPLLEGHEFPVGDMLFTRYSMLWVKYSHWGKNVRIYDSTNLFPRHSVAALGAMVGIPKGEPGPGTLRRLADGQPWSTFNPKEQAIIQEYCQTDARIVHQAVAQLQSMALQVGGQLRSTIAGIAMDVYRRTYHKWPWATVGPAVNDLVRPAYYGGRVENFVYGKIGPASLYDVTSLYPYSQRVTRFPHPNHIRLLMSPRRYSEFGKWEGVAKATVTVPDVFVPMLPVRSAGKLYFPVGQTSGYWPLVELRAALRHGATLHSVEWVIGSPVTFNPFEDFIDDLFRLRQGYLVQDDRRANLVKLILNSLYGRWGLNPKGGLQRLVSMDRVTDYSEVEGYQSQAINGRLFAYGPIETDRQPDYVNVLFAAQIAAQGRTILLKELTGQGLNALYCDTDSILTLGEVETAEGLGGWRPQMVGGSADLLGPKEYILHHVTQGDKFIAKGVPSEVAEMYLRDGFARFRRALPIREAIAVGRNPTEWVQTYRKRQDIIPKRCPVPVDLNPSYPWYSSRPYQMRELAYLNDPQAWRPRWLEFVTEAIYPGAAEGEQLWFEQVPKSIYQTTV